MGFFSLEVFQEFSYIIRGMVFFNSDRYFFLLWKVILYMVFYFVFCFIIKGNLGGKVVLLDVYFQVMVYYWGMLGQEFNRNYGEMLF